MTAPAVMVEPLPPARIIVVRTVATGFEIAVEPHLEGDPDPVTYPEHRQAMGFAGGLRLARGWPVKEMLS